MKSGANLVPRDQGSKSNQGNGPSWILIAGGALLSTLSVRLGFKLKQALDAKQPENTYNIIKGDGRISDRRKSGCRHSNVYSYPEDDDDGCFDYISGKQSTGNVRQQHNGQIVMEPKIALPLVTVPSTEFNKDNHVICSSSPDHLELPHKPYRHSNCSDSPCISESGSDTFSKREVIQKLRQQLKRRDAMIMEMQERITELQSSHKSQFSHSSQLQSLLDAANMNLLESEREIQRLRKAIADHCVGEVVCNDNPSPALMWPSEGTNGHSNGHLDVDSSFESLQKGRLDGERIEMLKREVVELKDVLEGKEYLLQNYKAQKMELSLKVKELQQRLDAQLPNML